MYECEHNPLRIEELVGVLEQSANACREAPDEAIAEREIMRWYSALRELAVINSGLQHGLGQSGQKRTSGSRYNALKRRDASSLP